METKSHEHPDLQGAVEMWQRVFFAMLHDLRNPMSNLLGFLELLKEGVSPEEREEILRGILISSEKMKDLLEEFTSWGEELMGLEEPSEIDFNDLIRKEVDRFSERIGEKKIDVDLISQGAVFFSRRKIVSFAVRNLVSNAIKFSNEGGKILIYVSGLKEKIRILICDEGLGMSEERLKTLFTSIKSSPGTRGESGTGLGLFLMKFFVEKIGGTVSVESIPGSGTTFALTFPKQTA